MSKSFKNPILYLYLSFPDENEFTDDLFASIFLLSKGRSRCSSREATLHCTGCGDTGTPHSAGARQLADAGVTS